MTNIDWKRKLTSRKFWLAVVGLVSGLMMAFKVDAETIETISGVIMAAASVIAYTIGEGINSDTFCIHIEKADINYNGIYAGINSCFAKASPPKR